MSKFEEIRWNLRKKGYLDFYYYLKNGKFDVSICEKPAKVFLVWGIEGLAPVSISAYTAREAADNYFKDSLSVEKVFCVEKKFGAKLFIFERTLKKAS